MDLQERLLNYLCDEMLQIDDRWRMRSGEGCTWWPHDLAQTITVRSITRESACENGVLLNVETDVLRRVPLDFPAVGRALNRANADNTLSTFTLDDDGNLRLRFSLRIFEDNFGWLSRWAAWLCACQAADAFSTAEQPDLLNARAERASSGHPTNGMRSDVDDVLSTRDTLAQQSREMLGAFNELEIDAGLVALGSGPPSHFMSGGAHTTQAWVIPDDLDDEWWAGHGDLRTVASLTEDPQYGPSLVVMTWPPYAITPDVSPTLASAANDLPRAAWSTATALGAWLADNQQPGIAVRTIIPAAMCHLDEHDGLAHAVTNVALYQAQQCTDLCVVVRTLTPEHQDTEPFVSSTVPAELAHPDAFGRNDDMVDDNERSPSGENNPPPRDGGPLRLPVGMVRSYVETLIERMTDVDKATSDADGDYPVRYGNAAYYVRVVESGEPSVQIFSIALADVQLTESLAYDLNEINTQLRFCRVFWVRDQVLFESEHLVSRV